MTCNAIIDLQSPIRSERIRFGFQPHWRTVFIYQCPACKAERRIFANSFSGRNPTPGIGGVYCGTILQEGQSNV